jgi:hypothetical protein
MTKKLFYPLFALVIAVSMAVAASAQGQAKAFSEEGWIVDKACSANVVKGGESAANGHSGKNGCAVNKAGCKNSGLGIYSGGKFHAFDAKGSELAIATLAKASKETGAKFKVVGQLKGEVVEVESITEIH